MKRKFFLFLTYLLLFLAIYAQDKTNVLLVTIDTLRWDRLSIYSQKYVQTPNIDRVGRRGAIFNRAFAHAPLTLPSHTNILTGTTSLYHGVYSNVGFQLADRFLTLAEFLKESKYSTAAFVASTVLARHTGIAQGFDVYDEPVTKNDRVAAEVVPRALGWIKKQEGHWFCWLHLWDPHTPYDPPPPFSDRFKNDRYSGEVAYVDRELAVLLDILDEARFKDRVLIIITGDHGEGLGDHGELEHSYFAYNSTIHIPLILAGPGIAKKVFDRAVGHIDIFPTICDLLKLNKPAHLRGQSLQPLLKGEPLPKEKIYFESKEPYYIYGWAPLEGFIFENKKYINLPIPELYDLANDFAEKKNIISSVRFNELQTPLKRLIEFHQGKHSGLAKRKMSQDQLNRLRSLGYISGFQQDTGKSFSRDKDLKVLLPIQNLFKRAGLHANKKEYQQAAALYRQIIAKMPSFLGAHYYLAEICEKQGKLQEAKQVLAQGLTQVESSKNSTLKLKYGILLAQTGENDRAITMFNEILASDNRNAQAWNYLGISQARKGQPANALKSFNNAVKLSPQYSLAYVNLGMYHLMLFQKNRQTEAYDEAVKNFSLAATYNPKSANAFNGRAIARRLNNEIQLAIQDWKHALRVNPRFVDVYFYLAQTYLATGDQSSAIEILTRCRQKLFNILSDGQKKHLAALIDKAGGLKE